MSEREPRFLYLLLALAALFVISWGIKASAFILNPILLAAMITIVVMPLPERLSKRGWVNWLALTVTVLLVIAVILLVIGLFAISIAGIAGDLQTQIDELVQVVTNASEQVQSGAGSVATSVVSAVISMLGNGVTQLLMALFIFVFMLAAAISEPSTRTLNLSNNSTYRRVSVLTQDVRRYMSIMTSVNILVALGNVILLIALDIPYALLWGLLAWITGYIPNVGFWIALIPPFILAWSGSGVDTALIVLVGYTLTNGIVQNLVQPRMMGTGLGISPVVVFISLFVWGWLLGGIGAILAVPLTMLVIAILDSYESSRWLATLMSQPVAADKPEQQAARKTLRGYWEQAKSYMQRKQEGPMAAGDGPTMVATAGTVAGEKASAMPPAGPASD